MTIPLRKRHRRDSRVSWATKDLTWLTTLAHRQGLTWSGGWIYAIAEDDTPLVKIGYTRTGTQTRLYNVASTLQASVTLVGLVTVQRNVTAIERRIHVLLATQCIEGEWFYLYMDQDTLTGLVMQVAGPDLILC